MLIDARALDRGSRLEAEVCVVGSGPAGVVVATELARNGVELVVLEAGGLRLEPSAQDTYRGQLGDGTTHDPLDLIREKRLGGTTRAWGGRCAPLDPLDLEIRPWVPGSGWPLRWEDIEPYYRRAHSYCELGEFEYRASAALREPVGFVTDGKQSDITDDALYRWSLPTDFWRRYGPSLSRAANARIVHHANVLRFDRDPITGRVTQAVAAVTPGREIEVSAKTFVLASGGLETARLLLASNRQTTDGIGNERGLVGRFYMTHLIGTIGPVRLADRGREAAGRVLTTRDGVYCRRMIKVCEDRQREQGLLNLSLGAWYSDPADPAHRDPLLSAFALLQLARASVRRRELSLIPPRYAPPKDVPAHLRNVISDAPRLTLYGAVWARKRWLARRSFPLFLVNAARDLVRLRFDAEQPPVAENRVELSGDRDSFGVPRLRLHYRVSDSARESIARTLGLVCHELARLGTGQLEPVSLHESLELLEFGNGTHQMGVARMAVTPRDGVVDPECRVHGARNLFVAGSATFPTGGAVSPTLTIVALAVRIADTIRTRDLAAKPVRRRTSTTRAATAELDGMQSVGVRNPPVSAPP